MGCGCNSTLSSGLAYRTPAEYLLAAKRLPPGQNRDRMMQQAAFAYATAQAALNGNRALASKGLRGLSALGTAAGAQTNDQLSTLLRSVGVPASVADTVGTVREVLGIVAAGADLISPLLPDQGAKLAFRWFAFAISPGGRTPPQISDADVRGLVDFCRGSAFLDDRDTQTSVAQGVSGIVARVFGDRSGAAAATFVNTLVAFFLEFRRQLCAAPRVTMEMQRQQSGGAAAEPSNCATLVCGRGSAKRLNSSTAQCECFPVPAATSTWTPASQARQDYVSAVTARKLVEGVLALPPGRLTPAAIRMNCPTSCALNWAGGEIKRVAGSIPSIPGTPTTTNPVSYFNAATAPTNCRCEARGGGGSSSAGGSSTLLIGGAAILAGAFFLLRR